MVADEAVLVNRMACQDCHSVFYSAAARTLVEAGGYSGARDKGTLRLEGRDYVMRDGDVITVKFTP